MSDQHPLEILEERGVAGFNAWRLENASVALDFRRRSLYALFQPEESKMTKGARARLSGLDLSGADLYQVFAEFADLSRANLRDANLEGANFTDANLAGADLSGARLNDTILRRADLSGANLTGASMMYTQLNGACLNGADLTDANIYGISSWNIKTDAATKQHRLSIHNYNEPAIQVPSIDMAQFFYMLRDHSKLRAILNTLVGRGVLLLGRFTEERKAVLDAVREWLLEMGYLPMIFDFDRVPGKDLTETILTLAGLSRFIIADLSAPRSVQQETSFILPNMKIPLYAIRQEGHDEWSMFADFKTYPWMIQQGTVYRKVEDLLGELPAIVEVAEREFERLASVKEAGGIAWKSTGRGE